MDHGIFFFFIAKYFIKKKKIVFKIFQVFAAKRKHVLAMAFSKLSHFEFCRLGMSLQRHIRFDYVVVLHPSAVHWQTAGSWSSFVLLCKVLFESSRAKQLWILAAFIFMWISPSLFHYSLIGTLGPYFVEDRGHEELAHQWHATVTIFSSDSIWLHQFWIHQDYEMLMVNLHISAKPVV